MTPNEAYTKLTSETNSDFTACFEMGELYLFGSDTLNNMASVNKNNGEVKVFNPIFDCTPLEFSKKTEIKDFR